MLTQATPMLSHQERKRMPRASLLDPAILGPALAGAFRKLDPRVLVRNPVMFTVEVVAALTTILFLRDLTASTPSLGLSFQIILWLWFTVLFANFAEAVAEGRGKAQAASLKRTRTEAKAKLLPSPEDRTPKEVSALALKPGDLVLVEAGDLIPSDGEVIEGVASVDESAITGESAPVIRESGGDRSAVTGGTRVLSDRILVRITAAQGSTFLDRMIALVEGAVRQKTPNEIALNILLAGMTLIFILAVVTIPSFAAYAGGHVGVIALVALFVTLIPTTIGALLSAIGIAGMDRLVRFNVLAMSGRAVEAAGDVDTLLLDKTGTITLGNRQASAFVPMPGVPERELADAAQLASLPDETPEGRSIVVLAKEKHGLRGRDIAPLHAHFVPFTAQTRMSGIDLDGSSIRKGAVDAIADYVRGLGRGAVAPPELSVEAERIARAGGTPLAVVKDGRVLGLVHLKDIVKGGIRERFIELRRMGIRTVMITGDNPLTAADLAAARWCFEHNQPAGRDAETLPGAQRLFFPMRTGRSTVGVLDITRPAAGPLLTPDERRLLDALLDQTAIAIERVELARHVDETRLLTETEQLRAALLASVSHDLKTPLASLLGTITSLKTYGPLYDDATREEMLATAQEEAERLARFLDNLLDITRLESGVVGPKREPVDLADVVGSALRRVSRLLSGHRVVTDLPAELPLALLDFTLWSRCWSILWRTRPATRRAAAPSPSPPGAGPRRRRSRSSTRGQASCPRDLGLPDRDGLALIPKIRALTMAPLLVLTVRDAEASKVAALDAGADDYMIKPFGVPELMARLRAALRHRVQAQGGRPLVEAGPLAIDLVHRRIARDGQEVQLSPKEWAILEQLAIHAGKVVTHGHLLRQVWGRAGEAEQQTLRVHMRQLRRKLEPDPDRPQILVTEPGVGYRLLADG